MSDRRPCQFFLRGSCRFGSNCRDYHPSGSIFEQSAGRGSNVVGTTSGFGTGGGHFNPFSSSGDKSSGDVGGGGVVSSPLGNFGGPFGSSSSSSSSGASPFGASSSSGPFGGGSGSSGFSGPFGSSGPFGASGSSGPFGGGSGPSSSSGLFGGSSSSSGQPGSNPFGGGSGPSSSSSSSGASPFGVSSSSGPFGGSSSSSGASPFGASSSSGPFGGSSSSSGASPFGASSSSGPFGGSSSSSGLPGSNPFGGGSGSSGFSGPFGSSGPFGASSSVSSSSSSPFAPVTGSSSGPKSSKSDNPVLQTLELIGIVVNSGVWPFGRIGLLNQSQDPSQGQTPVFQSLDLSIEEYRWRFYQNNPSSWSQLYSETLSLLTQNYNAFIERGKMESKLPPSHYLYNLDFSLFSKIGNWYLPNLGKDFASKPPQSSDTPGPSTSNPFGGPTNTNLVQSSPFETAPGGTSNIGFGVSTTSSSNNTVTMDTSNIAPTIMSTSASSPFGGSNTLSHNSFTVSPFQAVAPDQKPLGTCQALPNANNPPAFGTFGNANNSWPSTNPSAAAKSYSHSNPDVNDDNNPLSSQTLEDWEIKAFQSSAFQENKIPEKVPPKPLRI
ncbi:CCCH like finger domain nucleoporin [Cryptosporidium canis]|uniref:CCCH like finger domain nucleoporin n=1 Tax=Cryptosporidium canis TaxID=195482 RepID=A0A9D5DJF2_9CRYT|nr:CCCH like finger domain nucleoporin [Cryptosporidium canis]